MPTEKDLGLARHCRSPGTFGSTTLGTTWSSQAASSRPKKQQFVAIGDVPMGPDLLPPLATRCVRLSANSGPDRVPYSRQDIHRPTRHALSLSTERGPARRARAPDGRFGQWPRLPKTQGTRRALFVSLDRPSSSNHKSSSRETAAFDPPHPLPAAAKPCRWRASA